MKRFYITLILGNFVNLLNAQIGIDAVMADYDKDKDLRHAQYSYCIMEASTGKVLREFNSELALIPASTLKIITTSAALGILGRDFSYKTNYYFSEKTDSITGINNGNIIVKGSGDPSFNSSYFYENDSVFFAPFIKKLKTKGLKKINGTIITDASYFDNSIPSNWIWGDIGNYFGSGANGFSYKDNKFSIFYNSGETNSKALIEQITPAYFSNKIMIQSLVKSNGTEDNANVFGDPNSYSRTITGSIPPNKKHYEVEAQMPEPSLFAAYSIKNELEKNTILCGVSNPFYNDSFGKLNNQTTYLIYTHISPKLSKIVYFTNTKSNNHYAESLLKTISAVKSGNQGTSDYGIEAVSNFWQSRGVDVSGLHMVDGSGLSRANTITTKIQATVLSKIYRDSTLYSPFNASLPIAGKSGGMISLCKGTFAENNLRAKTGYINRARGYCGYVKTKSGKELAFSVLFNNSFFKIFLIKSQQLFEIK